MKTLLSAVFALSLAPWATTALADPLACDLSGYQAQKGLTAVAEKDLLTVTWQGAGGSEVRARYAIDHAQPVVRELAVRAKGGAWATLGQNLTPDFRVQTG